MNLIINYLKPSPSDRKILHSKLTLIIPVIICLYLIFILPIYFDNNAGSGMAMPQNIISWGIIVLCIIVALINIVFHGVVLWGRFMIMSVVAVLLLMLPWLWTPSILWQNQAITRMTGLAGALLFTFALCQVRITPLVGRVILAVIVFSSLIQSIEAMIQAWMPSIAMQLMDFYGTYPYGIFQQRNLLASWLATGASVTIFLALTAHTRIKALIWIVPLYPICAAIILSQSRTGLIGIFMSLILAIIADYPRLHQRHKAIWSRVWLLSSLLVWCVIVGLWAMPSGKPTDLVHDKSTVQREVMLKGTAELIKEHPISGNGLGSFEVKFPRALDNIGLVQKSDTVTHPHNEFMYVWAEGGITALTGFIILSCLWLWPLAARLRRSKSNNNNHEADLCFLNNESFKASGWLLPLTGLPLIIHMMLEYPLYLSTPHLILLIMLFRIGLPKGALFSTIIPITARIAVTPFILLISIVIPILLAGFNMQLELTKAEIDMNHGLIPTLPHIDWHTITQAQRLDYDRHLLMANSPGFLQQPKTMGNFTIWGQRWLEVHNDAEISAAMILIAKRRGDRISAEQLRANAAKVYWQDERFIKRAQD